MADSLIRADTLLQATSVDVQPCRCNDPDCDKVSIVLYDKDVKAFASAAMDAAAMSRFAAHVAQVAQKMMQDCGG